MRLLHAFQSVERTAHVPDLSRKENDVEHSYLLTMFSWYLVDTLGLKLDKKKVLEYGLIHDLVEVYAGDTYIFDSEALKSKHEREEKARLRIAKEFPEFKDLNSSIKGYEGQKDPEAVFVRTVDKFIPVIINFVQEGHTWKVMNVGHVDLFAHKREKMGEQKEVRELLEQIIREIEKDWKKYFNF